MRAAPLKIFGFRLFLTSRSLHEVERILQKAMNGSDSGWVVWITGLSGSGKTSICKILSERLKPDLPGLVVLDGDVVRSAFGNDLGYSESDRVVQIKRIQSLAKMLTDQGIYVIVGALYSNPELLDWNRTNIVNYLEVYLDASIETVTRRDSKGLYGTDGTKSMDNVVGMDIPWKHPTNPDLTLNGNGKETPDALADKILEQLQYRLSATIESHARTHN